MGLVGMVPEPAGVGADEMQRIDCSYLYNVGHQIHGLTLLRDMTAPQGASTLSEAYLPILNAELALDGLVNRSVFKLRFCATSGRNLLGIVKEIKQNLTDATDMNVAVNAFTLYRMKQAIIEFEANLASEFALLDTYIVSKKSVLDTTDMIGRGEAVMPEDLWQKVPDAIYDVREGTKCLVFELLTASGYHFHRANEAVLRRYYDVVTAGAGAPKTRNIGDFLNKLDKLGKGDDRVKAALRDLKDLHRNPLAHPGQNIETVDEAIDLMSAVRATVGQMLKVIPVVAPEVLFGLPAPTAQPS